ncbi:MAG: ABC transporter permease [Verrucomicrobiales bacterium]|jgi:ABC-2 type transport system permease protein|nr:ABC transporter permease [Verrucomicrobiales bacterium]MBP9225400.1 ABC transporter permease [Verrucomicrobiales bacterium]HQZ26783.1 ABC transporter permease subunit [Verrucomicrobiales bacterium]
MNLFFHQLGWELYRLFARRRTYVGFGVFLAVELLFYYLWTREKSQSKMEVFINRIAGGFDDYFSGLTLGFLIVAFTMLLLGTVFVALIAGDILAKETEDGNLRLILARPVSRFRLLVVKFLSCQIYTSVLFLFVGISALTVGVLERGWGGGMLVWAPELPRVSLFEWNEGLWRYFLAIIGFSLIYLPVTGMAFMLGCFQMKPATATILTVAIFVGDRVLSSIPLPAFDPYREYFITARMTSWLYLLHQEIPWARFFEAAGWLVGFGLTGFLIGWIAFERRDVKS